MPAVTVMKFRRGTAAQWTSANPTLATGEPGFETDTNKLKFGDGTTAWTGLTYVSGGASVTTSETAPSSPTANMVWFNSTEATAYIYYDSTWVPLSVGIAGPTGPTGVIVSDTAPTNTAQLWADPNATGSYIVPANGSKGQVLTKITDTSYDTGWTTPQGTGNAILNADFEINQRSFTSTTSAAYGFDRFALLTDGIGATYSAQTFTPGSAPVAGYEAKNYARIVTTGQSSTSTFSILAQRIEGVRNFAGQTVTLSFYARAGSGTPKIGAEIYRYYQGSTEDSLPFGAVTLSTSWARYSLTINIPSVSGKTIGSGGGYLETNLWVSGGSTFNSRTSNIGIQSNTFDIWGLQVEAGPIATPFRRNSPNLQAELAACQRFYQRTVAISPYTFLGLEGGAQNTTTVYSYAKLMVPMRVPPLSVDYGGTFRVTKLDDSSVGFSSIAINTNTNTNVIAGANITVPSGLTAGQLYRLQAAGDSNAYLGWNSEL
jgi:hypothetical protein